MSPWLWVLLAVTLVLGSWWRWRRYRIISRGDIVSIGGHERVVTHVDYRNSTITIDQPLPNVTADDVAHLGLPPEE